MRDDLREFEILLNRGTASVDQLRESIYYALLKMSSEINGDAFGAFHTWLTEESDDIRAAGSWQEKIQHMMARLVGLEMMLMVCERNKQEPEQDKP